MKTLFSTFIALYSMGLAFADHSIEGEAGFNLRRKSPETSTFQKVRVLARKHQKNQIELGG
jgi:hypothetical protein